MSDPYRVLGVPSAATDDEVTQAYRKLAKKYHPDVNPGDKSAERRMQEINAAYTQIKDVRSGGGGMGGMGGEDGFGGQGARRGYGGAGAPGDGWGAGGPFGGWWDPFAEAFGEAWARQRRQGQRPGGGGTGGTGGGADGMGGSGGTGGSGGPDSAGGREWRWQGEWRQGDGRWQQQWRQARQEPADRYVRAACASIINGDYQQAINYLMATNARDAEWHYYCAIAHAGVGNRVTAVRLARAAAQMDPDCEDYSTLLNQFEQGGYAYRQAAARQGFDMRAGLGVLMQCLLFQVICYCCCRV